jgi:hypothetical protein
VVIVKGIWTDGGNLSKRCWVIPAISTQVILIKIRYFEIIGEIKQALKEKELTELTVLLCTC